MRGNDARPDGQQVTNERDGGHAGREHRGARAALQIGERLAEQVAGGIAAA